MLVLELFLKGCDSKKLERIVLEMNTVEAKGFVAKLKEIERVNIIKININIGIDRCIIMSNNLSFLIIIITITIISYIYCFSIRLMSIIYVCLSN